MSEDRLKSLLRQKKLLEEHLEWLEEEISTAKGETSLKTIEPPTNRLASDTPILPSIESQIEEPDQAAAVPDIYESLGPDTKSSANDARTGCLIFFIAAFLILGGLVWWVYQIY